jgi:hypothetical protein
MLNYNTRKDATQGIMAAKLTILTHKIAIQLQLVAESCTSCNSCSSGQSGNFSIHPRERMLNTAFIKAVSTTEFI